MSYDCTENVLITPKIKHAQTQIKDFQGGPVEANNWLTVYNPSGYTGTVNFLLISQHIFDLLLFPFMSFIYLSYLVIALPVTQSGKISEVQCVKDAFPASLG